MISSIIQAFSLKFSSMSEKEKDDKYSMSCLTPKLSQNIREIIGDSLKPPSSPDLNPLHYAIGGVLEKKTNATSHPNIVSL